MPINKKIIIFAILIMQIFNFQAQSNSEIYKEISKEEKNFILKMQK